MGFNATSTVDGQASAQSMGAPNKLTITFDIKIFGESAYQTNGAYNVIGTDYSGHSIVYTCSETNFYFFKVKSEYAWILSRNRTLDSMMNTNARAVLASFTNVKKLVDTLQDCN